MTRPDPFMPDRQDALDAYLDGLALGGQFHPNPNEYDYRDADEHDAEMRTTVRALRALDDVPPPDAAFVAHLRGTLMDAPATTAQLRQNGRIHHLPVQQSAVEQLPGTSRRTWPTGSGRSRRFLTAWNRDWWPRLEVVAATVLILGLLGVTIGGPGGSGFNNFFAAQDDDPEIAATPSTTGGETAMYLGNAGRTGEMPGPGPEGEPGLLWREQVASDTSAPIVANGVVYMTTPAYQGGTQFLTVTALYADTGRTLWTASVRGVSRSDAAPAVADGRLFLSTTVTEGSNSHDVIALDAATGVELWRLETGRSGDSTGQSPVVVEDTVYITADGDTLWAIDSASGEERWSVNLPNDLRGSLTGVAVADGLAYVASNFGVLHAIDAEDGSERWSMPIGGNNPTLPVVSDGTVYVAGNGTPGAAGKDGVSTPKAKSEVTLPESGARLYAFAAESGEQRWAQDLDDFLWQAPTVANSMMFLTHLGLQNDEVHVIDAADGTAMPWSTEGVSSYTSPTIVGSTIYVGDFTGNVRALDAESGEEQWQVQTAGAIPSPIFVRGGVAYFRSTDGYLYAVASTTSAPGTPAATPVATNDVSGLPPCDIEPRSQVPNGELGTPGVATPASSVVPVTDTQRMGIVPGIAWVDLPQGQPASSESIAGIEESFEQMYVCYRPGNDRQLAALYSDDFFLRAWVARRGADHSPVGWIPGNESEVTEFEDARILPDGRVGVIVPNQNVPELATFYVFVEQGGRWLIDEALAVSVDGVEQLG